MYVPSSFTDGIVQPCSFPFLVFLFFAFFFFSSPPDVGIEAVYVCLMVCFLCVCLVIWVAHDLLQSVDLYQIGRYITLYEPDDVVLVEGSRKYE